MSGEAAWLGSGVVTVPSWLTGSGWPTWKNVPSALRMPELLVCE